MNIGNKVTVLSRKGTPGKTGIVIQGGDHRVGDNIVVRQVAGKQPVILPGKTPAIGSKVVVTHIGGKSPVVIKGDPCGGYITTDAISNPGFETGAMSPWEYACTSNVHGVYKHSGNYGLQRKFTSPSPGVEYCAFGQHNIQVNDGDWIRLWTKNITNYLCSVEFDKEVGPDQHEWTWGQQSSEGWKRHCFDLSEYLSPGLYWLKCWTYAQHAGTYENWWDDIEIVHAS